MKPKPKAQRVRKATLIFPLPEMQIEFTQALHGGQYYSVIEDFGQILRNKIKYEELNDWEQKVYEEVKAQLWELVSQHGVSEDFS